MVKGKEAIFNKIAELYFVDVRLDFSDGSIDTQSCPGSDNVMIMVTGTISKKQCRPMPFVRTVILSPDSDGHMWIQNDFWRLLDREKLLGSCEAKVHGDNRSATVKKEALKMADGEQERKGTDSKSTNLEDRANAAMARVSIEGHDERSSKIEVPAAASVEAMIEEKGEVVVKDTPAKSSTKSSPGSPRDKKESENGKLVEKEKVTSWAARAAMARNSGGTVAVKTTFKKSPQAPAAAPKNIMPRRKEKKSNDTRMREGFEVYLKKINENTTEKSVRTIYEPHAKILKVILHKGRGFGFVVFETESGARKVLQLQKAKKIISEFEVEERRTNSNKHARTRRGRRRGRGSD